MEKVLKAYRDKLMNEISRKKAEVKLARDFEGILNKVRDELSSTGKNLLSMFFMELKGYVERNNPEFIEKNKEKWQDMLQRAEALTEYGLYVAPVDILKDQVKLTPASVGASVFVTAGVASKLLTKKVKMLPAIALALVSGIVYSKFYNNKEKSQKDVLEEYINDAQDWIKTALENMYKIFKDAL